MNLMCSQCDTDTMLDMARAAGVDSIGVADAMPVPDEVTNSFNSWLASNSHAGMKYLENYSEVRRDPRLLLPGAKSIISCAIGYYHTQSQSPGVPTIASYAHGDDYHDVVKAILDPIATSIKERWGGETRVCVDTAPIHERYWAVAAGIAIRGKSGLVIVPPLGTYCFLAEIITTLHFTPIPHTMPNTCHECNRCINACPGRAIGTDATIDASKCLSYLTIEHRGDLPEGFTTQGRLYGCDTCQQVCPHNTALTPCRHPQFSLRPAYATLTARDIDSMSAETYAATFRHSAIKRAKLAGLKRNVKHL